MISIKYYTNSNFLFKLMTLKYALQARNYCGKYSMLHDWLTQLQYYYDFYNICSLFEIELVCYSEVNDGLSAYLSCLHIVFVDIRVYVESQTAKIAGSCSMGAVKLKIWVYISFAAITSQRSCYINYIDFFVCEGCYPQGCGKTCFSRLIE